MAAERASMNEAVINGDAAAETTFICCFRQILKTRERESASANFESSFVTQRVETAVPISVYQPLLLRLFSGTVGGTKSDSLGEILK